MTPVEVTDADLESWRQLQHRLAQRGERRLVLLEGERAEALSWLKALLPALTTDPGIWTGPEADRPNSALTPLVPGRARTWLGRESSVVVWDGWQGNPPDALAALSGTLRAGGLLFWLMPPLDQWSGFDDPDYARTGLGELAEHPFATRMASILAADPAVIRVAPTKGTSGVLPELSEPDTGFAVHTTDDQQHLIERLVHFGLGRRRRPIVVTADRGRGKSAALGVAAAELLNQGRRQILVSAPSRDNVATLFRHARQVLGDQLLAASESVLETRSGGCLRFLAIRDLLAEKPEAEVVLVDEAAAIPAPLLKQVLLGWPRVAFSSTVHGYEGAGRGFAIRFRQILDRETPHWQSISLSAPVRWSAHDPLEPLVSRLFLLAAENRAAASGVIPPGDVIIEPFNPRDADDSDLSDAFGLLVDAHYRTTPADLRQWMDAPSARSWRARVGKVTVGILWGAVEGGLAPQLAEQVTLGQRRLRGHLLPQSLASHSGFPDAACQRCLRVVRIAVSDKARRDGIGRRLVAAASEAAREEGLDTVGTSFGGSQALLAFWRACGLRLVRLGLNQEATSGEYPIQMLLGLSEAGVGLLTQLRQRQAEHWLALLPLAWPSLEPGLLAAIGAGLPATERLNDHDRRDLHSFAEGHRGFLLSLPVLRKTSMVNNVGAWLQAQDDLALWVAAVLQQRDWPGLQAAGLCLGQRDGEDRLRALIRELLQKGPEL
ncbi:tRNA(Met) cytidine acetyltransferase TmcA [Marinobacter sp. F4206]|uniref:tRNA(Met) cytidine acetyltransferase TmcA n=1 Tax=Marinobacter sp. F4206 TaxID=2861777 RepID=UPI001C5CD967|nr:GNAT family N-acetyltransferase [Marinobacter sp. F4206]MBW4934744.1 GNAT family N-acetyltransferase [Marinobacter sp. F4206]